jgi:iron complex transport system permease protein
MNRWGIPVLMTLALSLGALGLCAGSTGWDWPWGQEDAGLHQLVWEIRAPRTLGAALVGALLALAGAVAQGLFRNPLAEPYLLGSSAGAGLSMALVLSVGLPWAAAQGWAERFGLTGCAFVGAVGGVMLTLTMARGATHTLRLLLAGVVVGVVLGAFTQLLMVWSSEAWRVMQAFMLGNTAMLGWPACGLMAAVLLPALLVSLALARVLDALTLGEDTARSLGVPLGWARVALVGVMALATAAAVAQAGLIAFVGLVSPHLVRGWVGGRHGRMLVAATLMGAVLLMAADVMARTILAPQELPVGVLTAVTGGLYLLVLLHRRGRT